MSRLHYARMRLRQELEAPPPMRRFGSGWISGHPWPRFGSRGFVSGYLIMLSGPPGHARNPIFAGERLVQLGTPCDTNRCFHAGAAEPGIKARKIIGLSRRGGGSPCQFDRRFSGRGRGDRARSRFPGPGFFRFERNVHGSNFYPAVGHTLCFSKVFLQTATQPACLRSEADTSAQEARAMSFPLQPLPDAGLNAIPPEVVS